MTRDQAKQFCRRTRREFLWQGGAGFATVALSAMLGEGFFAQQARGADGLAPFHPPLAPKPAISKPKAKSVIFLFMYGGPSQVDTFDYKPKLYGLDGQTVPVKTFGRGGKRDASRDVGPKWNFRRYGQCGKYVSDLFPYLGQCVDDMAFIHSMTADSPLHGSAMLQMNTGKILSGNPCLGSWVNYGLGTVSQNLPGFVVMLDKTGGPISGAKNWSSGYMPATYQGTVLRPTGEPILDLKMPSDHGMTPSAQRRLLDTLEAYNQEHEQTRAGNSDLAARIASYELAYKMQQYAPEAVDLTSEPAHIKELYGVDKPRTHDFGSKCLLARRLVERGVRFVQLYSGGAHDQINGNWDAHVDIVKNHSYNAGNTDQPIAALLKDLKQRGLLDETLVVWGGEFGRQPTAENESGTGRDHNAFGFTMWMAGGGIKGGVSFGQTDELGSAAIDGAVKVKNLHATVLQLLGCDPNRLTYFFGGLNQKLVGVEGAEPINQIIA
jgi:hypothetical protein